MLVLVFVGILHCKGVLTICCVYDHKVKLVLIVRNVLPDFSIYDGVVYCVYGCFGHFFLCIRYIGVGDNEEVQLFYVFVDSQRSPAQDPLVLRFGAGPGCSGLHGFFFENGTFLILKIVYSFFM